MNHHVLRTTGVKLQAVYADTMDCFYKVVHYEGLAGLYRGMGLQLAYVATGRAWQAGQLYSRSQGRPPNWPPMTMSGTSSPPLAMATFRC